MASSSLPPSSSARLLALALALAAPLLAAAGPAAGAAPTPAPTTAILMLPEVATGLVISFALVGFAFLGIFCVLGIQTPDVLHSTHLPPGKES